MSSKLLKPGSELSGKSRHAKDLGLKKIQGDRIAAVSEGPEGNAAPIRKDRGYPRAARDLTGPGFTADYTAR